MFTFDIHISKCQILDDITTIIANLHGNNNHKAVQEMIASHPKFNQNYQTFLVHVFKELEKKLAEQCKKLNLFPVEFSEIGERHSNFNPVASCNYMQDSVDALMAFTFLSLNNKYDYASENLCVGCHTYFWWEQLESDFTYLKLLELFDISN